MIPADSDDLCVDHLGLYQDILDYNCEYPLPVIYNPYKNPDNNPNTWIDSRKTDEWSDYYFDDRKRFTNARFMIHNQIC